MCRYRVGASGARTGFLGVRYGADSDAHPIKRGGGHARRRCWLFALAHSTVNTRCRCRCSRLGEIGSPQIGVLAAKLTVGAGCGCPKFGRGRSPGVIGGDPEQLFAVCTGVEAQYKLSGLGRRWRPPGPSVRGLGPVTGHQPSVPADHGRRFHDQHQRNPRQHAGPCFRHPAAPACLPVEPCISIAGP
jgi:hypothetical protein